MGRGTSEEIAREILRYFLRNPQSTDDLEGLARWRLLAERIHHTVEETSLGLEWLVQKGDLVKLSTPGSEPVFCLNRENQARAQAFLGGLLQEGHEGRSGKTKRADPKSPAS